MLNQRGHGLSGDAVDLHRALDALRVGGLQARGGFGVHLSELLIQVLDAVLRDLCVQCGAHCGIGLRQFAEPVAQCLEVQHCSADQQWDLAALRDVSHQPQRIVAERGRGVGFGGVDDVDQVMRRARQGRGVRFGGADVHVAKHQCRIDADEFHRQVSRQFHRDIGLAAGGRSHQKDGGGDVFKGAS